MKDKDFGLALVFAAEVPLSIQSHFSKYHRQVPRKEIVRDYGPVDDTGNGQYHIAKIIPN
jgi:hypothetical protein